ncbi:MAG: hypothetical protein U5L46_14035 [Agrobacterium sp.]|nr:hypothetical protein [Agrobacterium sp.]
MRLGVLVSGLAVALIPALADAHNCKCRNRGVMFELGQTSCLKVDGGSYLARCEMKLNVSSWTRLQDGCPVTERVQQQSIRVN